jgi:Uma2 family endonuclease
MMQVALALEAPTRARLSLADWAVLPEDEPGEFVNGWLVEEEMPDYLHEITVAWLVYRLCVWLVPRGGFVGGSEAKFAVKPGRGRKPDASAYLPGRKPPRGSLIDLPPDIMVEVISPTPRDGRRDRVEKVGEYAAFGVRWYWLVDPHLRTIEVLELDEKRRYAHALDATSGVVAIPGCEGLTLDLDALWAELDRLEAADAEGAAAVAPAEPEETAETAETAPETGAAGEG